MKRCCGPIPCLSSARLLHDLISMTLMKGRGLLEELEGLIGLLRGEEKEKLVDCILEQHKNKSLV